MGVPTAPKLTGVLWMMRVVMTAARAGKPSERSKGAATAAGVPKPDAPSMNDPNSQATMMTCTRRSREISVNPRRIVAAAPLSRNVKSRTMAPKMIHSNDKAMIMPRKLAANAWTGATSHNHSANSNVIAYATGIARVAGQRSTTRKNMTAKIGRIAISA